TKERGDKAQLYQGEVKLHFTRLKKATAGLSFLTHNPSLRDAARSLLPRRGTAGLTLRLSKGSGHRSSLITPNFSKVYLRVRLCRLDCYNPKR
ncbi:MAG: hypothetical protein ACYTXY_16480, partial [Nostoc sp.]